MFGQGKAAKAISPFGRKPVLTKVQSGLDLNSQLRQNIRDKVLNYNRAAQLLSEAGETDASLVLSSAATRLSRIAPTGPQPLARVNTFDPRAAVGKRSESSV